MKPRCAFRTISGQRCPFVARTTRPGKRDGIPVIDAFTASIRPFPACRMHTEMSDDPEVSPEVAGW